MGRRDDGVYARAGVGDPRNRRLIRLLLLSARGMGRLASTAIDGSRRNGDAADLGKSTRRSFVAGTTGVGAAECSMTTVVGIVGAHSDGSSPKEGVAEGMSASGAVELANCRGSSADSVVETTA